MKYYIKISGIVLLFFLYQNSYAGYDCYDTTGFHEITVYMISPAVPISWQSPAHLYKSVRKSFFKKILHPQMACLGHMAFCLKTSLLKEPLWMGMSIRDDMQMIKQLYLKKSGLAVLGLPFRAKIEDKTVLERTVRYNAAKKNVMSITCRISEAAAIRILDFLSGFQRKADHHKYAPSHYYSAAFWPLYEGEGSSCSALCMSVLEAGGIKISESEHWKQQVRIPMRLIGGSINNGNKVSIRNLKKVSAWYAGNGKPDVDFVQFEIYDPVLVMEWVKKKIKPALDYSDLSENGNIPGVYFDYSDIYPTDKTDIIKKRSDPSLFIKSYFKN